jgi:hypothetical protein
MVIVAVLVGPVTGIRITSVAIAVRPVPACAEVVGPVGVVTVRFGPVALAPKLLRTVVVDAILVPPLRLRDGANGVVGRAVPPLRLRDGANGVIGRGVRVVAVLGLRAAGLKVLRRGVRGGRVRRRGVRDRRVRHGRVRNRRVRSDVHDRRHRPRVDRSHGAGVRHGLHVRQPDRRHRSPGAYRRHRSPGADRRHRPGVRGQRISRRPRRHARRGAGSRLHRTSLCHRHTLAGP